MRTLWLFFSFPTIYGGGVLLAAWSFVGSDLTSTGVPAPSLATIAATTSPLQRPATRWQSAFREHSFGETFDGGGEDDPQAFLPTAVKPTSPRLDAPGGRHDMVSCDASKEARLRLDRCQADTSPNVARRRASRREPTS